MSQINCITPKENYKHLDLVHYKIIEVHYNRFIRDLEAYHKHARKFKPALRSLSKPSKSELVDTLSMLTGASPSSIRRILVVGMVRLMDCQLKEYYEFSAIHAHKMRTKHYGINSSKTDKCKAFINALCDAYLSQGKVKINSIDELVNTMDFKDKVSTRTIYNYINNSSPFAISKLDTPRITKLRRRKTKVDKTKNKTKGTSIDERSEVVNNKSQFGHWEGDLVIGTNKAGSGALLTLVERQTTFGMTIKLKDKKAKTIYMAFNKLERKYGKENFSTIFKSITFDNGVEFSRFKDIEKSVLGAGKRTKTYFAHPYSSWERGMNENYNGILRWYIPKGIAINKFSDEFIHNVGNSINNKYRKKNGYVSSKTLFIGALARLNINYDNLMK